MLLLKIALFTGLTLSVITLGRVLIQNSTQIMAAVKHSSFTIMLKMFKRGIPVKKIINNNGNSLLHTAIEYGMEDIALSLIDSGRDVNKRNRDGMMPLHHAIRFRQPVVAQRLIEKKADVNAFCQDKSPLFLALSNRDNFAMASLLLDHGANIDCQDNLGQTLLHKLFYSLSDLEFLIQKGINVNLRDLDGKPALWFVPKYIFDNLIKTGLITFNHLRQQARGGVDDGKSIFWKYIYDNRYHVNVDWLWDKFEQEITLQDLCFKPQNPPSLLWILSKMAKDGNFTFSKLWQKFKKEITLEQLRESHNGDNVISFIWDLEKDTDFDFLEVWHAFKFELTMHDFCQSPYFYKWPPFYKQKFISLLPEILAQIPGKLPSLQRSWIDAFKSITTNFDARNAFFNALDIAQKESDLNKVDLSQLYSLAETVQNGGYANAFYDLGIWLKTINLEEAISAFAKVPPTSWHYEKIQYYLAQSYLAKAKLPGNDVEKYELLQKTLACIVNLSEEHRANCIKDLALLVLSRENDLLTEKDLPSCILQLSHQHLSVEAWLTVFDQLKEERIRLHTRNQQQKNLLEQLEAMSSELASLRQETTSLTLKIGQKEEIPTTAPLIFSLPSTSKSEISCASQRPESTPTEKREHTMAR